MKLFPINLVLYYLLGRLHQLLRFGDTALYMLEAHSKKETVTDTLIYHKFQIQIGFPLGIAVAIQLVNRFLASDGTKDGKGTKLINMMIDRLHTDGSHIGDKEAGMERT